MTVGEPLDAGEIVGLLADPDRLRVCAALALGAAGPPEVGVATGLPPRAVEKALARLVAGGLVVREGGGLRFAAERLSEAARAGAADKDAAADGDDPAGGYPEASTRVLRSFLQGGRLTSIPTHRSKRLVVLDWLAQRFVPGRRYPETEVNRILAEVHADTAALRRYLVDEGFLDRQRGVYWRIGGTFDVEP
ncbi:MAG TPA: DUF2087 domain-containing protein [Acidimicrobiales bacterium]|nr:DUF2087 domain-containing protein [Acidimicrobiales bacterium]